MDKETLQGIGLSEEQITKVIKEHKSELDGKYIPKTKFDEKLAVIKNMEEKEAADAKAMKDLQKLAGDADSYKEAAKQYEQQKKEAEVKFKEDMLDTRRAYALKAKLASEVVDTEVALTFFDKSKVVLDDKDNITAGYEDAFNFIKKEKAYLLKPKADDKQQKGITFTGTDPKNPSQGQNTGDPSVEFVKQMFGAKQNSVTPQSIVDSYTAKT